MKPLSEAVSKEALPVGDKPVIQHVVETMAESGIDELCIVMRPEKNDLMEVIGSGQKFDLDVTYAVQDEMKGLAGAIKAAENFVDEDSFAVLLGDNYVEKKSTLQPLIETHNAESNAATVAAFRKDDVSSHGVIDVDDGKVQGLVEKPEPEKAPSNLAVAGIYVFEQDILNAIEEIGQGKEGECQLTDAIDSLVQQGKSVGFETLDCRRVDVGTPERRLKADKIERGEL